MYLLRHFIHFTLGHFFPKLCKFKPYRNRGMNSTCHNTQSLSEHEGLGYEALINLTALSSQDIITGLNISHAAYAGQTLQRLSQVISLHHIPLSLHPSWSCSCAGVSTSACADVSGLKLILCALCGSSVDSGLSAAARMNHH